MKTMKTLSTYALAISMMAGLTGLVGCGLSAGDEVTDEHEEGENAQLPGNALAIPAPVRRNLGITFAQVESRAVTQTMRIPGRFELLPTAQHDYVSPVNGRVTLHVQQYQHVAVGDLLATIDSPDWREMQASLVESLDEIEHALAMVQVAEVKLNEQVERVALWEDRLARLAEADVRDADLEAKLADARLVVPTLDAELEAQRYLVNHAREQAQAFLFKGSALTGLTVDALTAPAMRNIGGESVPVWEALEAIEIRATRVGVVDSLEVTDGQWAQAGGHLIEVIAPNELRFVAESLQADLSKLKDGLPAQVVPPSGFGIMFSELSRGELVIGPTAHAEDRAIRLFMTPELPIPWARAGMVGFLEITLTPDAETTLAIPRQAMVRDGLEFVFFRRDPDNKDQVFRVVADTGEHDGRWIQVKSGVLAGDEVVMDGVYQLLAASSSSIESGGHFHSDGSFHKEDH